LKYARNKEALVGIRHNSLVKYFIIQIISFPFIPRNGNDVVMSMTINPGQFTDYLLESIEQFETQYYNTIEKLKQVTEENEIVTDKKIIRKFTL